MQFKNPDPFNNQGPFKRARLPRRPGCPNHDLSLDDEDLFPDDSERDRERVVEIESERLEEAAEGPKRGRDIMADFWEPYSDEKDFPVPGDFPAQENGAGQETREPSGTKYDRTIYPKYGGEPIVIDVYSVLDAFQVNNPAVAHSIKKTLCFGIRGKGGAMQDLSEAIDAIQRGIELERQQP